MTLDDAVQYEVRSSIWAPYVSWPRLQRWAGKYYARKARTKMRRYSRNMAAKEHIKDRYMLG